MELVKKKPLPPDLDPLKKPDRRISTYQDDFNYMLNLSAEKLAVECEQSRGRIREICDSDEFWRAKLTRDFPNAEMSGDLEKYYYILVRNRKIDDLVDFIIRETINDVYMKKKEIEEKYMTHINQEFIENYTCSGRWERMARMSTKEAIAESKLQGASENKWIYLKGREGERERKELIKNETEVVFFNYLQGTSQVKNDSMYYGTIFINFLFGKKNKLYIGTLVEESVKTEHLAEFDPSNFTMPPDIQDYMQNLIDKWVPSSGRYSLMLYILLDNVSEIAKWIILESIQDEQVWETDLATVKEFLFDVLFEEDIRNTKYPMITMTKDNLCRKIKTGPWNI